MPRPSQGRKKISLWVKESALDEVDRIAEIEGVADRSEMLRRLLGLGVQAWQGARVAGRALPRSWTGSRGPL